jgi:hypothetical protein
MSSTRVLMLGAVLVAAGMALGTRTFGRESG